MQLLFYSHFEQELEQDDDDDDELEPDEDDELELALDEDESDELSSLLSTPTKNCMLKLSVMWSNCKSTLLYLSSICLT